MGELTWIEIIYWAAAIIGGTLFVLRTILMFVGGGVDDGHFDTQGADDFGDVDGDGSHGISFSFSLLSLQGLTAFFTMFGLVGLTLYKADVHVLLTILGGTAAGLATVALISLIFSQAGRLQSAGNLDLQNAIGQTGTVYLRIPEGGSGQVQVAVQGRLQVCDAVTADGAALATGATVQVTGLMGTNTLVVTAIRAMPPADS